MIKTRTKYRANPKARQGLVCRSSKTQRIRRLLFWLLGALIFSIAALVPLVVDFPGSVWLLQAFFSVAAVLLWIMVYQSVKLNRNAHLRLDISPPQVCPGETFAVEYRIQGSTERFTSQSFILRAREYITVDINDSIHSETNDVYERELLTQRGADILKTGKFELKIPDSLMHSFNEHSHRFEWHLLWKVKQRGLPDIRDKVLLDVSPAPLKPTNEPTSLEVITLDDQQRHSVRAGDRIRQALEWNYQSRPDYIEHRIVWIYKSRDREHEIVVRKTRINVFDAKGRTSIDMQLPTGPYSYDGKLLSIDWAIDTVAFPSRESNRQYFSLAAPN